MVITGPGDESLSYWGGHSTLDTAADRPVDLPAVIEIQDGRICGQGIRAYQRPFEEFGHTVVTGCGDNFPIAVEHAPQHRCESKQTENPLHGVP